LPKNQSLIEKETAAEVEDSILQEDSIFIGTKKRNFQGEPRFKPEQMAKKDRNFLLQSIPLMGFGTY
jgi:hypothetical protein